VRFRRDRPRWLLAPAALLAALVPATLAFATTTLAFATAASARPIASTGAAAAPSAAATGPRAGGPGPTGGWRTVTYHGYSVRVPRSWPVYNLALRPHTCVRFNRHALYLGVPGANQRCPAEAAGRTEAILLEPLAALARARAAAGGSAGSAALAPAPIAGAASVLLIPGRRLAVLATWRRDPRLIAAALGRARLPSPAAGWPALPPPLRSAHTPAQARLSRARLSRARVSRAQTRRAADVYTGPGFDTCDAPSAQAMAAWGAHSPYHAIGIYIGGANAACPPSADPNLSTAWLAQQASAGWHYVPTYVGLQAPSNSCGCAPMATSPSRAAAQGRAAAQDAVAQAQALGFPAGTPLYDDMEYYDRSQPNNSTAVLAFLSGWTTQLHAQGYLAGVYGNANSAIADLASKYGTGYPEPDDIWFAAWPGEGSQTTNDTNIPSSDWTDHQRLHQYSGAHNETYGGYTLNIDGDYLDGATADTVVDGPVAPPALSVSPTATGVSLIASWGGLGQTGWSVLAGASATQLTPVATASLQGAQTTIPVRSAAAYFAVQALGSSGQVLASSGAVADPAHLAVFGHSTFVGQASSVGAVPVGCYQPYGCHLTASLWSGRTLVAAGPQQGFRAGGSGLLFYRLTPRGRALAAAGGRLPVRVVVRDAGGASLSVPLNLIPFFTAGRSPARGLWPGPLVGAAGATDYVWGGWSGGILVRCAAVYPCAGTTGTLSYGRTTLASLDYGVIGGGELGYLFYTLSAAGHQLLARTPGNQLGVTLTLRLRGSVAHAQLVLVSYR